MHLSKYVIKVFYTSDFPLNLDVSRNIKTVCHHLTHNMSLSEQTLTKEVCSDFGVGQINGCLIFSKLVLNQLLENSRLIDNRLNEEDFPLPTVPKVNKSRKRKNRKWNYVFNSARLTRWRMVVKIFLFLTFPSC